MESNLDILIIKVFKHYNRFTGKQWTVKCKFKLNCSIRLFSSELLCSCYLFLVLVKKCLSCRLIHKNTPDLISVSNYKILVINLICYGCLLINSSCMCLRSFICCCCMDFRVMYCLSFIFDVCMESNSDILIIKVFKHYSCLSGKQWTVKCKFYINASVFTFCCKLFFRCNLFSILIKKLLSSFLIHKNSW